MSASVEERLEFERVAEQLGAALATDDEVRAEVEQRGTSATALAQAAAAGWFELLLAEEAGGLGLGPAELAAILRPAGRHLFPAPLIEHAVALPLVIGAGGDAVSKRLESALVGERLLAVVDPEAAPGGDDVPLRFDPGERLNGTVSYVPHGAVADDLLVIADEGASLAIVSADAAGVTTAMRPSLDSRFPVGSVTLDSVAVELLANPTDPEEGRALLARIRDLSRLAIAAQLAGSAARALEMAVEYAGQRRQYGRPIGSFQALAHLIAEMARAEIGLVALCAGAAAEAAEADPSAHRACLVAKAHAARAAREVIEGAMQVHGGIAFTMEHGLHEHYRRVLCLAGLYGEPARIERQLGAELLAPGASSWPS